MAIDNVKLNAFLPCRLGSERVPNKNIKRFSSFEFGLIEIKIEQLLSTKSIDNVILSTNDERIIKYAESLGEKKLKIFVRDDKLSSGTTTTDSLIEYASDIMPEGHILWTHVTSPFLSKDVYEDAIGTYYDSLNKGYDSLMTVSRIQGFLWNGDGAINYDRSVEKWPRTQTIPPVFEVNSGIFLAHKDVYIENKDRIGLAPYMFELDRIKGFDIDWEDDFMLAEYIHASGMGKC
ncbi:cytidylyltransferase domain-containing protein [Vibrio coralliilyticus]|uniref:acylneuraminate cytidylyltransferase family protein n=1 Tax=Vibrio coralliilyticus TaxID=190893 RepID=UPI003916DAD3